jgi:ribonucleoside-triphosphate reductase
MGNVYDPTREIAYSRGNLSFTTINLPMLALEAKKFTDGDVEKTFYELLDKYLEISKKQLLERFELQSHLKVKNLPFLMGQGVWLDSDKLGPEDEVGEILKHGSLSIGFIGLAEALVALYGHHHGEGKEYWDKGYNIIKHMREYTDKLAEETHLNFSVLATPSEGLCGTALRKTKKMFGEIEGVTDKEYFTNSSHIPVSFNISIYDKIKLEAPFHELCNAGHIAYVEIDGDAASNTEAIESIVRTMHDLNVGYGAINHPVDRDPVCGYTGVIGDKCPNCGRTEGDIKFDRIRRVTGYLAGTLDMFNDAKRAEERDRVKHGGINNL